MKQTIVIKPKKSTSILLMGEYRDAELNKTISLTMDGEVLDRPLLATERLFKHSFSKSNARLTYDFNWDEDGLTGEQKVALKGRKLKEQRIVKFWERHPQMEIEGGKNPFLTLDNFVMQNIQDMVREEASEIKEKLRIANTINNYDFETQRDVCYAFGGNPIGKSQDDIMVDLLHKNTGRLMINWQDFDKKWNKEKNRDVEYLVRVKKAIALGIIQTRNNNLCLGQEVISANGDVDAAIIYFKNNHKTYEEFLCREVDTKDVFKGKKQEVDYAKQHDGQISDEITILRNRAKELGIKGYQVMKESALKQKIQEAEKAVEA